MDCWDTNVIFICTLLLYKYRCILTEAVVLQQTERKQSDERKVRVKEGFQSVRPPSSAPLDLFFFFSTELWNLGSLREDDPSLYFQPLLLLSSSSSTSEASTWDWIFYFTVLLSWCVTERSRRVEVILFIIIIYIFSFMEWCWTVLKDGPHIRKCNKSVIYHIMSSLIQS